MPSQPHLANCDVLHWALHKAVGGAARGGVRTLACTESMRVAAARTFRSLKVIPVAEVKVTASTASCNPFRLASPTTAQARTLQMRNLRVLDHSHDGNQGVL